jgi:uncharacterized membrane protein
MVEKLEVKMRDTQANRLWQAALLTMIGGIVTMILGAYVAKLGTLTGIDPAVTVIGGCGVVAGLFAMGAAVIIMLLSVVCDPDR